MTPNEFRELALSFPEVIESAHMLHPDFRVGGRIFGTLGYPDEHAAMVKLSPEEQNEFVRSSPSVFQAAKGAEAAFEKLLTQAHGFANPVHDLIGNFVSALRAAGENIVDE